MRRAGVGRTGDAGGRRAGRRGGHGTRWLNSNIRPSRGTQAITGARRATRHTEPAAGRDRTAQWMRTRRAGIGRTGDAGGRRSEGKSRRQAEPAARRDRPHRRRGRAGAGRRGGHGTRWLAANIRLSRGAQEKTGGRRATRHTEPAAGRDRTTQWMRTRAQGDAAGGGQGTRWLPANIHPSRGAQAKTGGGQNPRRAGLGRAEDAGGRAGRRGGQGMRWLPANIRPSRGGWAKPAVRRDRPHRRRGRAQG